MPRHIDHRISLCTATSGVFWSDMSQIFRHKKTAAYITTVLSSKAAGRVCSTSQLLNSLTANQLLVSWGWKQLIWSKPRVPQSAHVCSKRMCDLSIIYSWPVIVTGNMVGTRIPTSRRSFSSSRPRCGPQTRPLCHKISLMPNNNRMLSNQKGEKALHRITVESRTQRTYPL